MQNSSRQQLGKRAAEREMTVLLVRHNRVAHDSLVFASGDN
jgi:hypothetical protein